MTETGPSPDMTLRQLQSRLHELYGDKDRARGLEATYLWFAEETGELAAAIRLKEPENLAAEFADVLAWLATLANLANVDLTNAVSRKYGMGCPGCGASPCRCSAAEKP
ncbi:MAG TPA: MazG nucleotide pyrophosphohydrolase domain-containing protein [Planctomycetia bacterium]|nr:MazG nucleotide pyrophosphohydrolase domain-containing protein [Planctomycetia bacterium]